MALLEGRGGTELKLGQGVGQGSGSLLDFIGIIFLTFRQQG